MPALLETLPKELKTALVGDQSIFVRAAVEGVVKEAGIAAGLTALMILLFLGSWRSTIIICISIPLSILVAVITLAPAGADAECHDTRRHVAGGRNSRRRRDGEIENVHRNMAMRKPLTQSILDGAQQIAMPAFVSTLCICIVFVPVRLHRRFGAKPVHSRWPWPWCSQ